MKTRILGMAIGLGALWAWSPGCSQPKPECNVGAASAYGYVAKLTLISGDETCNPGYQSTFEEVGMQTYNPLGSDGKTPDTTKKLVALQTLTLGDYMQNALELGEETQAYSLGEYADVLPDDNNTCTATNMSPARVVLPVVPGEGGGAGAPPNQQEALDVTVSWDNVSWYVTTANLGNQAEGTMTYRDNLAGCEATYRALMLWPIVGCEELRFLAPIDKTVDEEGNPVNPCDPYGDLAGTCEECDPNTDESGLCEARGTGVPNDALCDGEADPEPPYEIPFGSGISPDLTVRCDPAFLFCFLSPEQIQRPQD